MARVGPAIAGQSGRVVGIVGMARVGAGSAGMSGSSGCIARSRLSFLDRFRRPQSAAVRDSSREPT